MYTTTEINEMFARKKELEELLEKRNKELSGTRESIKQWKTTALKMRERVFMFGATPTEHMLLELIYADLEKYGEVRDYRELNPLARVAKSERARACVTRSWDNAESVQGDNPPPIFWIDEAEGQIKPN